MHLIRAAGLPVSRWANGAGRKADIAAGDGWMLGYAWLDGDAPFSDLAGFDRTITLVEGPGFTLDIAGAPLVMDRLFVPGAFDGGAQTACRVRGPCRVLNVMTARGRFRHTVEVGGGAAGAVGSFVVALRGTASMAGVRLARLDAVQHADEPVVADGPGGLLATVVVTPWP